MTDKLDEGDEDFLRFRKENPNATFAQYYAQQAVRTIKRNKPHSTLGARLYDAKNKTGEEVDFWQAGVRAFGRYIRMFSIQPSHKVIDYGCGSLRLGVHFIRYLDTGHYFGLDVTTDFIEMGKELLGAAYMSEKKPQFGAIGETSLVSAESFQADFVFSNAVSYHVHPEETASYFANLARLAHKAGSRLLFDAKVADEPVRFQKRGWASPEQFFVEALRPLRFVSAHYGSEKSHKNLEKPVTIKSALMEFCRE